MNALEHLAQAQQKAQGFIAAGSPNHAFNSFVSDLGKYDGVIAFTATASFREFIASATEALLIRSGEASSAADEITRLIDEFCQGWDRKLNPHKGAPALPGLSAQLPAPTTKEPPP